MSLSKTDVKEAREVATKAMEKALKKLGMTVSMGNIRYSDTDMNVKITITKGTKTDAGKNSFNCDAAMLAGLDKSTFGKKFISQGKKFKVTRFDSKKRKYPVMCTEIATGKTYKFPTAKIATLVGSKTIEEILKG